MPVSKSKLFFYSCMAFVVGIGLASFINQKWPVPAIWFFTVAVGCLITAVLFWQQKYIRIIGLIGLFLFLGIWRYGLGLPAPTSNNISFYNGQDVTFRAVLTSEAEARATSQHLEVKAIDLSLTPDESRPVRGTALVTANKYPEYNYGDTLEIKCRLAAPEPFSGFAYDRYLARYNIYSVCYYPEIALVDTGGGHWFFQQVYKVKNKIRSVINQGLKEPASSLALAIVLGDKSGLPDNVRQFFSQAGISHVIAISGMHISIITALVFYLLMALGLNRRQSFYAILSLLSCYIILIGAPPSAVRAGIMGLLVLWGLTLGRSMKLTNALVLAGTVMLLVNPKLLRDDIGFQLSFMAVWGIVYSHSWGKAVGARFKIINNNRALAAIVGILTISVGVQIFTWPIVAINFSQISILAPISNILVVPLLPLVLTAIILAVVFGLLWPVMSPLFFLPAFLTLSYVERISQAVSNIPGSYYELDYLWVGWAVVYYLILFIILKYTEFMRFKYHVSQK